MRYARSPRDPYVCWDLASAGKGDGECHPWPGSRSFKGYGVAVHEGRTLNASRWVFQQLNGVELPVEVQVQHKCDNPPCVNWRHLKTGYAADNSRDMVERGRHRNGGLSSTWVPARTIESILIDRLAEGSTYKALSKKYGVSTSYAHMIVNGHRRREVTSRWPLDTINHPQA